MNQIDQNKVYSLNEIIKLGVLGKSNLTVVRRVLEDKITDNLLDAEITGPKRALRYRIKGKNLINYLDQQ